MIPRMDWLSFTPKVGISPIPLGPTYTQRQLSKAIEHSPDPIAAIIAASEWQERTGKNFYKHWLHRVGGGCDIFSSPDREEILIEVSGIGCSMIDDPEIGRAAVEQVAPRITRLDLAADFHDPLDPFTFAHNRTNNRFRRISTEQSDTGSTVYIGSRTSDKYARVYRYSPPHPRNEFLRVEMVYKRKQAKEAADYVAAAGIADSVIAAGNYYGWNHQLWKEAAYHGDELSAWSPDRGAPDSVRWLLTQVVPALKRMETDGIIEDAHEFMQLHLFAGRKK